MLHSLNSHIIFNSLNTYYEKVDISEWIVGKCQLKSIQSSALAILLVQCAENRTYLKRSVNEFPANNVTSKSVFAVTSTGGRVQDAGSNEQILGFSLRIVSAAQGFVAWILARCRDVAGTDVVADFVVHNVRSASSNTVGAKVVIAIAP
jgi:hypothetical protein